MWTGQPPKEGETLPDTIVAFKPPVLHTKVPGKLGSKLSTRLAAILSFGETPPALRTRRTTVIQLPSTSAQSWVLKVSAHWNYTEDPWERLVKKPWYFLRRWLQPVAADSTDMIGDTWAWKTEGSSVIKGYVRIFDAHLAASLLSASGSKRGCSAWFVDPVGSPPPGVTATKILWSPWQPDESWQGYHQRVHAEASSNIVLGYKQLGIRVCETDARYVAHSRLWSLRWLPKMATRIDANIMLSSMGFMEIDLADKHTRRQGTVFTFRAKRDDSLEIVQGCFDAGDGPSDVQAILETKRCGRFQSEKPLAVERKVQYRSRADAGDAPKSYYDFSVSPSDDALWESWQGDVLEAEGDATQDKASFGWQDGAEGDGAAAPPPCRIRSRVISLLWLGTALRKNRWDH